MSIPSVDLSDFLSGNAAKKNQFVQSLGKAYEEVGFGRWIDVLSKGESIVVVFLNFLKPNRKF